MLDAEHIYTQYTGLNAQFLNNAIDFAISLNFWCVEFTDNKGTKRELISQFAVATWLKYCSHMVRIWNDICVLIATHLLF